MLHFCQDQAKRRGSVAGENRRAALANLSGQTRCPARGDDKRVLAWR